MRIAGLSEIWSAACNVRAQVSGLPRSHATRTSPEWTAEWFSPAIVPLSKNPRPQTMQLGGHGGIRGWQRSRPCPTIAPQGAIVEWHIQLLDCIPAHSSGILLALSRNWHPTPRRPKILRRRDTLDREIPAMRSGAEDVCSCRPEFIPCEAARVRVLLSRRKDLMIIAERISSHAIASNRVRRATQQSLPPD